MQLNEGIIILFPLFLFFLIPVKRDHIYFCFKYKVEYEIIY
jgi:hypothetical protein